MSEELFQKVYQLYLDADKVIIRLRAEMDGKIWTLKTVQKINGVGIQHLLEALNKGCSLKIKGNLEKITMVGDGIIELANRMLENKYEIIWKLPKKKKSKK